jgi:hypothetical protein
MAFARCIGPAAAAVALCLAPSAPRASGCNHDIVVPIHFEIGAKCWRHSGPGTSFTGQFRAGQHIEARAMGLNGPWQLTMIGPHDFSVGDKGDGRVAATVPASGNYSFSIGPCSEWGAPGNVEICAQ